MKSKDEKAIEFQLKNLDTSRFEGSDKIIKVKVEVGSGAYEDLSVVHDDVMLECTMAWNTGSFEYDIPAKELIKILKTKPVDTICSADLANYDKELIKVTDGDLECKKVNDIEIENEKEIIESLKGTSYEITSADEDDLYTLIADQMQDLYSRGDISDSEYTFHGLFSMEFFDEELGDLYVDWHYQKKLIKDANSLLHNENYEKAISVYKDYMAFKFNKSLDEVFGENKFNEESLKDLKEIAKGFARCFEELDDYENAATNYKLLIPHTPDSSYNYAHLAYCCLKLKHYEDSEKYFNKAIEIKSSNIWAISWYADTLIEQNKINEGIEVLNEGIKNNPTQPSGQMSIFWLYRTRGDALYTLEKWGDSIESYLKASKIDSSNAFTFLRLGFAYFNTENYEESYNSFELCQEKNSDYKDASIYYHKGECKRNLKNYESAIEQFDFSINKNSEEYTPWAYKMKGNCFLELNDFSNAADSYVKGHKDKWTYHNLGKAHYGMAKYELALEDFGKVLEIDPKYKWAYHWMGDTLFELEEYEKALEKYESLIERDDSYIYESDTYHILQNLALLYHFKGEYEKANSYYKQDDGYFIRKEGLWWHYCKKLSELGKKGDLFTSPKNIKLVDDKTIGAIDDKVLLSKIFYSRGSSDIYYYSGENKGKLKFDLMISDLDKAVELGLDDHEFYFVRASCISGLFHDPPYTNASPDNVCEKDKPLINIDRAIEDLKKYLEIENVVKGHILLINCYSKNNDLKGLEAACKNAVTKFASDDYLWSKIGRAWKDNKDYKKSLEAYKKAAELDPDYAFSFKVLGEAYLDVGDSKNAIKAFKKAESLGDDNELFNWCLSKAYLLDNQLDLAHSEINKSIASYSGDKNYFIQYAKVCGEIYKDRYPLMGELMLEYIEKTSPQNGRNEENKKKHKDFLNLCDSFNATYCNGSGLIVVPEDKKHALNGWSGDSCLNELFETWEHFKESDIKEFIEHGSYKTKYHLSLNKSLNKDQILMLLESGSFSVLENAASNKLVDLEDIKNIVSEDDGSYSCSYKLLGVLSNPNVNAKTIDGLKDNKYGWVRKKVFSIINNYNDDSLKDRYKVLGLIENPNIDSKLKEKLKTSLSGLESNKYKLRFSAEGADTLEYVYGEFDLDEMAEHINKSLSNGQESWGEYCADNWYDFGESEYGLNKSSIDIKIEVEDKQEGFTLNFGSEGSESTYGHDGLSEGKFAHVAASYESGEYGFADFDLEFEFRPENINLETTDYKLLISGIEYSGPSDEDNNYSEGELINTRTHGTDIELYFKTQGSLIDVTSYDDILEYVDHDNEKITEASVKKHFESVLTESKNNEADKKKNLKSARVLLSGSGSEFNQGFISKEDYSNWVELDEAVSWGQYCKERLEKDGYWEISDVSSFTAINRDSLIIEIKVKNKVFFKGTFDELVEKHFNDEGEISNSKNASKDYGKSYVPENWDTFFSEEEFKKRDKVLVSTSTNENFSVKGKIEFEGEFDIKKFGLVVVATDEMGYGIDFGDFVLGFRYEENIVECEFPGGVGVVDSLFFDQKEEKTISASNKKQDLNKIISNIDMEVLGEIMGDKAESIEYSDHNIVVFNIEAEDLEAGAFEKMEEIGSVEYGDWNMLGGIVSEEEVNKIKKDFNEDLKKTKENEENEIDDYSQIYMSFLYCEGVYVWSASTAPIG